MSEFSTQILRWYADHGRKLPWRSASPDPYAVWVSEIMLQQTRLETVLPYFDRWMMRFPTVSALAAASEQDVLSVWEGLGYYSRARNFHRAARIVVQEHEGRLPADLYALRMLPGVGRYTAGAIASIAFDLDVPTLDANIRRVLARVFNVSIPAEGPEGLALLWHLAEENLPIGHAGDFNQALMDLGATICLPRDPACLLCPVRDLCQAYALGVQNLRPLLKPKVKGPHYIVTAAVMWKDGKVLLAKRPSKGLLGGLWEFPGGKVEPQESLQDCLAREIREELGVAVRVGEQLGTYKHAYTHFSITLHAFFCDLQEGEPRPVQAAELAWVARSDLSDYPMGKVDRLIAGDLQ
jgi:A/G-specific adenine glycosylase